MSQHIHCTVNDCHYWSQGNICKASEILVVTDEFGESQPDHVDATMASQYPSTPAGTCMSTCCKTYVPKGSENIKEDNVTKM